MTGPTVLFDLVELTYADTGDVELYQLPLAVYPDPQDRLDHALLAEVDVADHGHSFVYDAVHDRDAMAHLLRAFAAGVTEDGGRAAARRVSWCSTGCPGTSSTWTPTRRCSAASSPTPR